MIVGQNISGGKPKLDLPTLVDTRFDSGQFGRRQSWLLWLIVERADIQTTMLDNEGEFADPREAVDVLLIGASGELPPNPRHAALPMRGCARIISMILEIS
jgi:hypothetical protein